MKGAWWKLLSVLILIYTFTVGMLVPLKPGVKGVDPDFVKGGEQVVLTVNGYNTHFEEGSSTLRAWLKLNEESALSCTKAIALSETVIELTFDIPKEVPTSPKAYFLSLIIDNAIDGAFVLPDAINVKKESVRVNPASTSLWKAEISDLHQYSGMTFPYRNILGETIRNTYFHVPLWFGMIIILSVSVVYSIRYLRGFNRAMDIGAVSFTSVGVLYGILGLITGAVWAKYTWGSYWSWDIKQIVSAVALLIYLAYFVLRNSFEDEEQRARLSAVYNIFAFAALIPLLFVIPRLNSVGVSLHPGNGGNPGFGGEDLDNTMRMVFYPAIIGWTLLGVWVSTLLMRIGQIQYRQMEMMS